MSCPGPSASRKIPRISTCIGSGFTPSNTVYATPFIPRFTSESGKNLVIAGADGGIGTGVHAASATIRPLGVCGIPSEIATPNSNPATAVGNIHRRIFIGKITSYRLLEQTIGQRKSLQFSQSSFKAVQQSE